MAWRLKLPSILLLLVVGFIAGPATGFLHPGELLGELLLPIVSISVALILFEGGLSLDAAELREIGSVVRNLISVGVFATWLLSSATAYLFLGFNSSIAVLFGAILVVTGPTVIVPLLRDVRPTGRVRAIAKWEGIMNDPVGALLAVLVFEGILAGGFQEAAGGTVVSILKGVLIGGSVGLLGAGIIVVLMRYHWVPDFLQNPFSLMVVIGVFTASNLFQTESGLLAVTLMGIALANQRFVPVRHIIEFKENLRVLLISSLFILLTARLERVQFTQITGGSLLFLGSLILVVRPVAVALSTLGAGLSWRERLFLACLAPRGIVAAAVTSVFALRLAEEGHPAATQLVPQMFVVIAGTVAIYGLAAGPIARGLGLAESNPQGVLIVGAHPWAIAIGKALQEVGIKVQLVDTNRRHVYAARMSKLPTYHGSILSRYASDEIDLAGIGRLLALTPNDEANSLAALHFAEVFDRKEVYQLVPEREEEEGESSPQHLRGRLLFGSGVTHSSITKRFDAGARIKTTALSKKFNYNAFRQLYSKKATPLFLVDRNGTLTLFTVGNSPKPQPGQSIIRFC